MYDKLFDGIPDYVRITIFSCVRKLSTFANFNNHEDVQDLVQELLLFYIEHFHQRELPSDAYVVASLQNYAKKLLKTKMREPFTSLYFTRYYQILPDKSRNCSQIHQKSLPDITR